MNSRDPLAAASPAQLELFERFGRAADGFSARDTIGAAANVMINALRQAHATRSDAERSFDEWSARIKGILMDCYDSTGRKKGIFPYPQHIELPLVDLRAVNGSGRKR